MDITIKEFENFFNIKNQGDSKKNLKKIQDLFDPNQELMWNVCIKENRFIKIYLLINNILSPYVYLGENTVKNQIKDSFFVGNNFIFESYMHVYKNKKNKMDQNKNNFLNNIQNIDLSILEKKIQKLIKFKKEIEVLNNMRLSFNKDLDYINEKPSSRTHYICDDSGELKIKQYYPYIETKKLRDLYFFDIDIVKKLKNEFEWKNNI